MCMKLIPGRNVSFVSGLGHVVFVGNTKVTDFFLTLKICLTKKEEKHENFSSTRECYKVHMPNKYYLCRK